MKGELETKKTITEDVFGILPILGNWITFFDL